MSENKNITDIIMTEHGTYISPETERQRQLREDMYNKLRQAKESEEFKNLPDTAEAFINYFFNHFAEELRVIQQEHSRFYAGIVGILCRFLANRLNNNQ